jgi:uncharacterized protein YprB with RNaseH-like and TPR domain
VQIPEQDFLNLVETTHTLIFVDIEAMGLRGDYNSVLCVSIKPYGKKAYTFQITKPGNDRNVVKEAKAALEEAQCWATYYGKGFDIKMLNTRLLRWEMDPIEKRPHIDMYYSLKSNLLTARKSQGHLLSWLKLPEQKMTVSADDWSAVASDPKRIMPTMVKRCESDVKGLEDLYKRTRHLIKAITT